MIPDARLPHRERFPSQEISTYASTARGVERPLRAQIKEAHEALQKEFGRRACAPRGCWDEDPLVRRGDERSVHLGTTDTCMEKSHGLPPGTAFCKYKGRGMRMVDRIRDHDGHSVIFQAASCPPTMSTSKVADLLPCWKGTKVTGQCRDGRHTDGLRGPGDFGGASCGAVARDMALRLQGPLLQFAQPPLCTPSVDSAVRG